MDNIGRITELMQGHDWFFDYSEDHRKWSRGFKEKQDILRLMKHVPMTQIPELLSNVPEKLRKQWEMDILLISNRAEI